MLELRKKESCLIHDPALVMLAEEIEEYASIIVTSKPCTEEDYICRIQYADNWRDIELDYYRSLPWRQSYLPS